MATPREPPPPAVPATAKQGGDVRARWAWAEPAVWTDRMATALEQGVKGGVWFSPSDQVSAERNLRAAATSVAANHGAPGVDQVTVEAFLDDLDTNLAKLTTALRDGSYEPQAIRRVFVPKPGSNAQRPLGIPTVRDRVAPGAVRHVLEPTFERAFAAHSYGFRPGRGCQGALRRVDDLLGQGDVYVVEADRKRYFDTIPHERLLGRLRERIADRRLLTLIESFLKAGIWDGTQEWEPEAGAPHGAVRSPLLSNISRNPLGHQVAAQGFAMVRYADDFVIRGRSQAAAEQARALVRQWCDAAGLTLHPTETQVVDVRATGFDFLG